MVVYADLSSLERYVATSVYQKYARLYMNIAHQVRVCGKYQRDRRGSWYVKGEFSCVHTIGYGEYNIVFLESDQETCQHVQTQCQAGFLLSPPLRSVVGLHTGRNES